MKQEKILVPYYFSGYDQKALDFVIRTFASHTDADITIFAAYTPVPQLDLGGSPIMDKVKGSLNYLEQRHKEQDVALKKAAQNLIQSGFPEQGVHILFLPKKKDVAVEIIKLVNEEHFTLVVLNHKPGKATHFFTGNVFSKVVKALKDTTICVVT